MATLHNNFSLKQYNTFGIEAKARYFFQFEEITQLQSFITDNSLSDTLFLILGGGSNILFTDDFQGIVIHPNIKGIEMVRQTEDHAYIKAGANEVWDDLVAWCVDRQLQGIENLSLIPGVVGATPVQNIGAYGVEAQEVIETVEAINIESGQLVTFKNEQCEFGYRNSIFKNTFKDQFVITHVTYRLNKNFNLKTHYGSLSEKLKQYQNIDLQTIRKVVIEIRNSKLPDPAIMGNAGSFFKNPILETSHAQKLKQQYPKIPLYSIDDNHTKVAAGWLIEQCGWKGKRMGNAAVHNQQALVLVNHGQAKGLEVITLANAIRKAVLMTFNIYLDMEVIAI